MELISSFFSGFHDVLLLLLLGLDVVVYILSHGSSSHNSTIGKIYVQQETDWYREEKYVQ